MSSITVIDLCDRGYEQHAGGHVHPCPECYEDVACEMTCSTHPDREREDGMPRGSHVVCEVCRASTHPPCLCGHDWYDCTCGGG